MSLSVHPLSPPYALANQGRPTPMKEYGRSKITISIVCSAKEDRLVLLIRSDITWILSVVAIGCNDCRYYNNGEGLQPSSFWLQ
jgi:hypothetical protein